MKAVREILLRIGVLSVIVVLLSSPLSSVVAEEEPPTSVPLGLEISASLKEIIIQHREAISSYIMEIKTYSMEAAQERLRVIDEYHQRLKQRIQLMNQERENLLGKLMNGTISPQEFSLEMRRVRMEAYALTMFSEKLGRKLGEIGRNLSENLTLIADEIVEVNKFFSDQLKAIHQQIREELSIGVYKQYVWNVTDCRKLQSISDMLSRAISRLEEAKNKLIEKIENLKNNISAINESLQQSSPTSSECLELLNNLTARLDKLEKEIFDLNKTRSWSMQKLNQLHEELSQFTRRQEEVERRIDELENQYRAMVNERRELENRLNVKGEGSKEREKVRERLQELLKEMDKSDKTRRQCNELLNEIRNRIEKHLKAIEELRNATQRFSEEIRKKIREHGEVSKIIRELKEKCGVVENRTVLKMYVEKSILEKRLEFLENTLKKIEMKIEMLSNWLREVDEKIAEFCRQSTGEKTTAY